MIEGLQAGQPVQIVIERFADGRHRIADILPAGAGPTTDMADDEVMDHSSHEMLPAMDHSDHQMPMESMQEPEAPMDMDHSGHDKPPEDTADAHAGHDMEMQR